MGIGTLGRFLIGDRQAILELAANRWALVVGFLFVLSAGLAREYDGVDLLAEPWHVFIPLPASLLAAFFLFAWVNGWSRQFPSFLGLFWLTAPLAWLYAIPYEHFLTPVAAVKANLYTLGVVACWRVLLMIRVLSVVMNYQKLEAIFLVVAYGMSLSLAATCFVPVPLIDVMSGSRLSEGDRLLKEAAGTLLGLGLLSLPVWLGGAFFFRHNSQPSWLAQARGPYSQGCPSRPLWALAAFSLGIWVFILPLTQPPQQLRSRVEAAFQRRDIAGALAEMSAHQPEDFPPHWQPPPRFLSRWIDPLLLEVLRADLDNAQAPWVRAIYKGKLREWLRFGYLDDQDLEKLFQVLSAWPEGPALIEEMAREGPESSSVKKLQELLCQGR